MPWLGLRAAQWHTHTCLRGNAADNCRNCAWPLKVLCLRPPLPRREAALASATGLTGGWVTAMSALEMLLDQQCFWIEWAAVSPPLLLQRMGHLAMREAQCDKDLLDSLLFAASRVWPSFASWPAWPGYHLDMPHQLDTLGWGLGSAFDSWSQGLTQGAIAQHPGPRAAEASNNALPVSLSPADALAGDDVDDGAVSCAPENLLVGELAETAQMAAALVEQAQKHLEEPTEVTRLKRLKRLILQVSTTEFADAADDLKWISENMTGGEDVERRAAKALDRVDTVLQRYGHHEAMKKAQRKTQDVLLLACCRLLDPDELQEKGIPDKLHERLNRACQRDVAKDLLLWARLGKAKYHLFTNGQRFSRRKPKLSTRKQSQQATDAAGAFALDTVMEEEDEIPSVVDRLKLGDLAEGLTVLDLSGTCGGFAISAAQGHATRTVVIEQREISLETCRRNYVRNRISFANGFAAAWSHHSVLAVDALDFLREAAARGDKFDIVVFRLQGCPISRVRHREMNRWVFSVLRDGGLLVAYPCSSEFEVEALLNAGRLVGRSLWKEVDEVILEDHRILKGFPMGEYMQEGIHAHACYFRVKID